MCLVVGSTVVATGIYWPTHHIWNSSVQMASRRRHAASHDWTNRIQPGWCHWFRVMQEYRSYQRQFNWTGGDILASTQVDNLSLWDVINHSTYYVQTGIFVRRVMRRRRMKRLEYEHCLRLLGNRLWLLNMCMFMTSTSSSPGQHTTCQHTRGCTDAYSLLQRNYFITGLVSEHGLSWTVFQIDLKFWTLTFKIWFIVLPLCLKSLETELMVNSLN